MTRCERRQLFERLRVMMERGMARGQADCSSSPRPFQDHQRRPRPCILGPRASYRRGLSSTSATRLRGTFRRRRIHGVAECATGRRRCVTGLSLVTPHEPAVRWARVLVSVRVGRGLPSTPPMRVVASAADAARSAQGPEVPLAESRRTARGGQDRGCDRAGVTHSVTAGSGTDFQRTGYRDARVEVAEALLRWSTSTALMSQPVPLRGGRVGLIIEINDWVWGRPCRAKRWRACGVHPATRCVNVPQSVLIRHSRTVRDSRANGMPGDLEDDSRDRAQTAPAPSRLAHATVVVDGRSILRYRLLDAASPVTHSIAQA